MEDQLARDKISAVVGLFEPYDELEEAHLDDIGSWISSGVEIFRIQKDAVPPKHLVSYSVVVDSARKKVLLLDHKKALLMLPSGGHVDRNEMPFNAAKRELKEELELSLNPVFYNEGSPFFATVTETVGINEKHTDVSLWYLFDGDSTKSLNQKSEDFVREFGGYSWLSFDEILSSSVDKFDPHMHRFVRKLEKYLG